MSKENALKYICEQSALISNHPDVFSCTWIAYGIQESVYKTRKYMKELESEGYVKKSHEGGIDDWTGNIFCIHGYELTEKGIETDYYKKREAEEIEYWNQHLREM